MANTVNEDGFRFGMSATGRDSAAATATRPLDEDYDPLSSWPLFGHLPTVNPNPVIDPYSWHHVDRVPHGPPTQPNLGYSYNPLSSAPEMYTYLNHLSSADDLPQEEIQTILGQSLSASVDALPRAKDYVADSASFRCNKTAIGSERKSAEASRAHRLKMQREELMDAIPDKPYGPFMYSRLLESPSTFEEQSTNLSSSPPSSSSRPTYSEIAKLSKEKVVNSRTESPKDDIENFQKKMSPHDNSIKSPSHKLRRVNSSRKKQNLSASILSHSAPVVSPDSKYGLDKFEQIDKKEDWSRDLNSGFVTNTPLYVFSDGTIPVSERKESSGSISSSFSGIEDIPVLSNSRTPAAGTSQPKLVPRSCPLNAGEPSVPSNSPKKKDNKKDNKTFVEARKPLQNKKAAKPKQQQTSGAEKMPNSSPILNNGIPAPPSAKTHYGTHRQSSGYINNDLREFKKWTNASTNPTMASGYRDTNYKNNDVDDCCNSSNASCSSNSTTGNNTSGGGGGGGSSNSGFYKNVSTSSQMSSMSNKMKNQDRGSNHRHHSRFLFGIERTTLDDYAKLVKSKLRWLVHQLWMMTVTSVVLVLAVVTGLVHMMILVGSKVWNVFVSRIWKKYSRAWKWKKVDDKTSRKIGLDENIKLPSTGEEAMQRLLSCRGKDPYSILGLKADSTDEDIKKYYKKQAILVHPDKNSQTGAEEAFKILRHAFEMIGEPEKRVKYDAQMQQSDQAMREFADLLNKLKERFKQEANMMKCDQCGGKHQRIPVDKPWYSARYCDKCNINHPAKEGDVWAQTSMLGFLWHYYACMDGHVYDITEWVSCRKGLFKHLKSNSHQVFYRIETDTDRGSSHRTGEADLDGFINQLLNQARQSDPSNSTSSTSSHNNNSSKNNHNTWSHQQSTQTGSGSAGTAAGGASNASKMAKRKRKKKRH